MRTTPRFVRKTTLSVLVEMPRATSFHVVTV